MIDPLALALRELRDSPNTEAAGWKDAADADSLRRILARAGHTLVPAEPTPRMIEAARGRDARQDGPHIYAGIWRAMLAAGAGQDEPATALERPGHG